MTMPSDLVVADRGASPPTTDHILPSRAEAQAHLRAVRDFQLAVRELLTEGHDYGVIPGAGARPTLLKPGAEKIAKLLSLADTYEIVDRIEDWDRPLFRYLVRCRLLQIQSGAVVAEGLGECNSMEARYRYRWAWGSEISKAERDRLRALGRVRTVRARGADTEQYRIENEDVYSLVNTLLKMAAKRALVAAALSAGRLSDLFTQDLEDLVGEVSEGAPAPSPAPPAPRAAPDERAHEGEGIREPVVALASEELWQRWLALTAEAARAGIHAPALQLPVPVRALERAIAALEQAVRARRAARERAE